MDYLCVPNLEDFQHYKNRTPPWIKLHNSILEDYEYTCLPDASKFHLVAIWLLASRTNNKIPADPRWIANKISATGKVDIKILIKHGFLKKVEENQQLPDTEQDASNALAARKQNAIERRGEESRVEREESRGTEQQVATVLALPLNDKSQYPIQQKDLENWSQLYPAVDVLQELRKMCGWLDSNPRRRKTKRGIGNFITTWLAKEQDRGGTRAPTLGTNTGLGVLKEMAR